MLADLRQCLVRSSTFLAATRVGREMPAKFDLSLLYQFGGVS